MRFSQSIKPQSTGSTNSASSQSIKPQSTKPTIKYQPAATAAKSGEYSWDPEPQTKPSAPKAMQKITIEDATEEMVRLSETITDEDIEKMGYPEGCAPKDFAGKVYDNMPTIGYSIITIEEPKPTTNIKQVEAGLKKLVEDLQNKDSKPGASEAAGPKIEKKTYAEKVKENSATK